MLAYIICGTILLYSEDSKGGGGFLAGFLIGGAVFGTLGYVFAPQVLPNLQVLSLAHVQKIPVKDACRTTIFAYCL